MNKRKITKKEVQEKQVAENRKFNRTMLVSFSLLFLLIISTLIFYTYWSDTKYSYRKTALYCKIIPGNLVCMDSDYLLSGESREVVRKNESYFFCSDECSNHFKVHFKEVALSVDAFSGETIPKAGALIGLKRRGNPEVIYFKDYSNFEKYYNKKSENKTEFQTNKTDRR